MKFILSVLLILPIYVFGKSITVVDNAAGKQFDIAFHSYPGQWYELKEKDTTLFSGIFLWQ